MNSTRSLLKNTFLGAIALALAGVIWLPGLHLFYKPNMRNYCSANGLSRQARMRAASQLRLWSDPAGRAQEIEKIWMIAHCMNTNLLAQGFLKRAAFLALHLLRLREYTSFLSGTYVTPGNLSRLSAFLGAMDMLSCLGFVILMPIFVIAGSFIWLYNYAAMATRRSR
jgi:hypothetical protein